MQQDFNPQAERRKNTETDKYVLFLTSEFSQWFPSDFQDAAGRKFNCAEQYMMFRKAELFGDAESAQKILDAKTPDEQKALGRGVKGFDKDIWNAAAQGIVVVQSTRAGSGRTFRGQRLRDAGFLIADNLSPQKARILLALALTVTSEPAEIERIFRTY